MTANQLAPADLLIEQGLAASTTADCVILVEELSEAEVRFANNRTTTNGVRRGRRVTVIAISDGAAGRSAGVASRSGAVDITDLVRQAEAVAAAAEPAADAHTLAPAVRDSNFGDVPALTSLDVLSPFLHDLGPAFTRAASASTTLAGFATHRLMTTYLGTSSGQRRRFIQPTGSLEFSGRSHGGTRSAWIGVGTTDFRDIELANVEDQLNQRLRWAEQTIAVEAGRHDVVLAPSAVADLMAYVYWTRGGQDAEDGTTVFSAPGGTRVGDRLSPLPLTLYSDPTLAGAETSPFVTTGQSTSSTSVFDNGRAITHTDWIADGRLNALQYHEAGAARSGVAAHPAADNLVFELPGASASLDELVVQTERGLLVSCLWYIREVDPTSLLLTGLTRDGVYLIENGAIVGQVNNFRFNESPVDLLSRITAVGKSERTIGREVADYLNRTVMPPVAVSNFNMSTVSQAT